MIVFKITLSILGDDFFPSKLPNINEMRLRMVDSFNPTDERSADSEYGFGSIDYMHNDIFVKDDILEFEEDFVKFIEMHHTIFEEYMAKDYHIFTEVYYSGYQCNFEILSLSFLNRLSLLNLSIAYPVSVYKMKKKEIKRLLDKSTHWQ